MVDYRKLIKFGNSSFVVSLPTDWIKKNNLKKGDVISISQNLNNELTFALSSKDESLAKKEISIAIDGKDKDRIKREIISSYINNYNFLKIHGKTLPDHINSIKKTLRSLMAVEIVEETPTGIVAKDFVDLKEVTFEELIRKIDTITRSMMADVNKLDKQDISKSIVLQDESVNKMMYLLIRTLRLTLANPGVTHIKNRTNMNSILNVWDVALTIEKIADSIKRVSRSISAIKDTSKKNRSAVRDISKVFGAIEKFYWETMKSYYINDKELAFQLSNQKRILSDQCNELHEKYWNVKEVPVALENFKDIISSIHNLGRRVYS